ncbi:MAG TPA: molybdenum cofactor biosynthesis protein MoaE [Niabella sp.]|nr:molybdenum cofactor biosynthesis protein MoaE [Niabella sp.]HQW14024.1 molybdenum cofactor biosynthesis protein MoaE [Niabella sp.]HQX19433.1 molybdenum cofactor biosynthesis protein MoaE [Niabella sp.]HQX40214.1 molybdenum cofactor biosynthesis protein MoaE [Niabella sp.]HRB05650.1 molybdenum cofactor biosynthesis protein MoaE [Niabella sp.]
MNEKKAKNCFIEGAIPPEKIAQSIAAHQPKTNIGGHAIFLGQVRADLVDDKEVQAIEFTTYREIAIPKLETIREDIFSKYPISCMHIYHSLGVVKKGEICLFVFTSSAHRKPAQEACSELVERIKAELPIWGKEIFTDETYQWKENK